MKDTSGPGRLSLVLLASRPQYLLGSVAPVLVGSALGYAVAGAFNPGLFVLATLSMMALHAGANVTNDYFDHVTRNDWLNENPTPFSGGSRFIQQQLLSPKVMLLVGLGYLGLGCGIGLVIVALSQSWFILGLGIVGVLGAFFYTAGPVRLGYRGIGEVLIGFLFGILPVYGAYYLQTGSVDAVPVLPALIVAILIFLVILINEFPDFPADSQVHKNTLVVQLGIARCAWVYRIVLSSGYIFAALMLLHGTTFLAGALYFLTLPLAFLAIRSANSKDLVTPGLYRANKMTILLHHAGSLALTLGLLVPALRG